MSQLPNIHHHLFTGHFRSFEERLATLVRKLKTDDTFAEIWIIVPNQLTRLHLRRRLSEQLGIAANLRFMTLNDLMHTLAEPIVLREGWQTLGEAAVDPLLTQIIDQQANSLEYLAPVAKSAGFRRALLRTRQELWLHQIEPSQLLRVELYDRERAAKLRDLAKLLEAIDKTLNLLRWHDAPSLQSLALRALESSNPTLPPLVLYGLYDFPPLTRSLLTRCFASTSVNAFLPHQENNAAFAFTESLKNWYTSKGFTSEELTASDPAPHHHFVSAANDSNVATEIVRDILYPVDASASDFAVILPPSSESLAALLKSRCREAGLAPFVYQAETLGETAAGRGLYALCGLLVSDFELDCMGRYLLAAPFTGDATSFASEWYRIAQEALVLAGENPWRKNISRLLTQLTHRAERIAEEHGDEDESLAVIRRRVAVTHSALAFLERLFAALSTATRAKSWNTAVQTIWEYYSSVIAVDEEFADLLAQLEQATLLDQARIPLTPSGLRDFLCATLKTPGSRTGRYPQSQPVIAAREQCYGLTFSTCLLPGYNEGILPRADSQDPLLLDSDRQALNASLKTLLPLRREWQDRENFWFAVTKSSATAQVYYYTSRSDRDGRPQLVSPYLSDLLTVHSAAGNFDRTAAAHPLSGHALAAISASEYHRIALGEALNTGNRSELAHLWSDKQFSGTHEVETARYGGKQFGSYKGVLSDSEILNTLAQRYAATVPFSPTALEEYWKCPFRYAVIYELEAYAPEEISPLAPVSGRERGTLIHSILQKYHGEQLGKSITANNYTWERLVAIAQSQIEYFAAHNPVGPAYSYRRLHSDLLDTLHEYHKELVSASSAWHTQHVELSFGRGEVELPEPLQIVFDNNEFVRFKGRIDRWDEDAGGAQIRLTDYKSGKKPDGKSRGSLRRLQLAIYQELAQQNNPTSSILSQYQYLTSEGTSAGDDPLVREQLLRTAVDLATDMRNGIFAPDPNEKDAAACLYCRAKLACGAVRHSGEELNAASVPGLRTTRSNGPDAQEDHDE